MIPENDRALAECIRDCMRRNQMQAVGFEVIEAKCRQACTFDQAIALLNAPDSKDRIAGVEKLRALKDKKAVPYLAAALKREFMERTGLWAWIIPALGSLGDRSAVPVLLEALSLSDESWMGRGKSADALGKICDPSSIPALIQAVERGDTREAALKALAGFRDKRVIPVLLTAIQPEEEEETREAAMKGLRVLGGAAVPALITAFTHYSPEYPDTRRRRWLCQLLGESGDERAINVLRESLRDPDETIRKCAERYAGR